MQIDFYCEFPTEESFEKLRLIDWQCRVFIAAHSVEEFKKFEEGAREYNKKISFVYWPIVKNSYWVSPFSNFTDLKELFGELENFNGKIMLDLEFPLLNKKLIFRNLFSFLKNKKLIVKFMWGNKERITTAQAPPVFGIGLRRLFGLDYNIDVEKGIMFYSSAFEQGKLGFLINRTKRNLEKFKDKENYLIGLGTIATGVVTTEKILSLENLESDLNFVRAAGFERVCIFRVGGLSEEHVCLLKTFLT